MKTVDVGRCTLDEYMSADVSMQQCLQLARAAARTDLPVLILGETGTGKTLMSRAIHLSSKRAKGPFTSFNVSALSESLLDSQLFGHEKGAFTHADKLVKGKFEVAHKGTLFLDEIADMSLSAQSKILRVVEYGEFERLGSEQIQTVDVRVISATHLSLNDFVAEKKFRHDLFYRLSGITIHVPALRERPNDLRALIAFETKQAAEKESKIIRGLTSRALEMLLSYSWPGNLRELNRVIHSAVALADNEIIGEELLLLENTSHAQHNALFLQATNTDELAKHSKEDMLAQSIKDLSLKTAEAAHILKVLSMMGGNKRKTARALGVSRSTLDRKLSEVGIEAGDACR